MRHFHESVNESSGESEKRALRECFGNNLLSIAVQKTKNLNLNFFCVTVFFLQRPQLIHSMWESKYVLILRTIFALLLTTLQSMYCEQLPFTIHFYELFELLSSNTFHIISTEMASQQTEVIHTTE